MKSALYAGSFDPITNGHLDIIQRAANLFNKLTIVIARNSGKSPLFSIEERILMVEETCKGLKNVDVSSFKGLLKDAVTEFNASCVIRGLRSVSDYEYESQMAMMNRHLSPELETVFLVPTEAYSYVSSRLVREVAGLGGNVDNLVPPIVSKALKERFARD